jgi:hypothetical protein
MVLRRKASTTSKTHADVHTPRIRAKRKKESGSSSSQPRHRPTRQILGTRSPRVAAVPRRVRPAEGHARKELGKLNAEKWVSGEKKNPSLLTDSNLLLSVWLFLFLKSEWHAPEFQSFLLTVQQGGREYAAKLCGSQPDRHTGSPSCVRILC